MTHASRWYRHLSGAGIATALILSLLLGPAGASRALAAGGDLLWQSAENRAGKQESLAAVQDSAGNVILAGYSVEASEDMYVVKLAADSSGALWSHIFDRAGGNDRATAVAVDHNDDVIVAGYVDNGVSIDFQVIKYCGVTRSGVCTAGQILWQQTWDSPNHGDDYATAVGVDALGDVYVGGYTQGVGGSDDFLLIKYKKSGPAPDGSPLWQRTYDGAAGGEDRLAALAVNDTGVVVTGHSQNANPDFDYLTVKYGLDGATLWESRFDGGAGDDRAVAVAMDPTGDVVVTGVSYDGSHKTMVTRRLAAADGALVWSRSYGAGNLNEPRAVAVDLAGDVYLTGVTFTATGKNDFYTARYRAADGTVVWEQVANSGGDNADTTADIAVDEAGDVYVTGYSHKTTSGDDDFFTIKYKRDTGAMLWAQLYDGPAQGNDQAVAVAVGLTPNGTLVVAGWADQTADGLDNPDLALIAYDAGLMNPPTALSATTVSETGIDLAWTDNSNGTADGFQIERCVGIGCDADPANFTVAATVPVTQTIYHDTGLTPHLWYIYRVKALSAASGDSHYSNTARALTTVFTPSPPTWVFQHDGPENADDRAEDIAVGPDGRPVATGSQLSPNLGSGGFDYYTVKLDPATGAELWHVLYNDPDDELDVATCVGVDTNNDVVVSGYASLYNSGTGNTNDIYTIKYPAGGPPQYGAPELWAAQYDGPANGDDRSVAIDLETGADATVVVTGYGKNAAFNDDIYVIKYAADGTQLWAAVPYDGPGGDNDYPARVRLAPNGDVVVCGTVTGSGGDNDFFVQRLAAGDGTVLWTVIHDSGNGNDGCNDLVVAPDDTVYAVGSVTSAAGDADWYIDRYDAGGVSLLAGGITVDGTGHGYDEAKAVRYDPLRGEIVVAGDTTGASGSVDFLVQRRAADGTLVWNRVLDRDVSDDFLTDMAMDPAGGVYLAGDATDPSNIADILAVAYDPEGNLTGSLLYDGAAGRDDTAAAIAVNAKGAAFISGATTTANDDTDYLVLRFDPDMLLAPTPFTATPHYTSVDLAWTDRADDEDGFEIRRAVGTCAAATDADFVVVATLAADTTTYTDTGLVEGDTYCYRIQAFTNAGLRSLPLDAEAMTTVPPAPDTIAATADDANTVTVTWNDTSTGEDLFAVARCQGSGCTDFTEIGTVPTGTTTFTDTGLCAGTTYTYTVRALHSGDWSSAYGTPTAATPPAAQPPANVTATRISEGEILLDWTDPNLAADTQAITIERCQGTGCTDFAPLATLTDLGAPPDFPLVRLEMDETAWNGTAGEVADSSGNGNHGTAKNGATTTTDAHRGRAGAFDGTDDEVDITYHAGTPTNTFTLAAWVKTTVTHQIDPEASSGTGGTSGQHYLFGADHRGSDSGAGVSVGTNGISVYEHGSSYMPALAVYSGSLGTGWNHVVVTYTNKTPRIYLNGVLVHTGRTSYKNLVYAPTRIGAGPYGAFNGQIDEVTIYDRALSDAEVDQLYHLSARRHQYRDTTVVPGQTYAYRIVADKPGACGWPSPYGGPVEATATMLDPSPLAATATSTTSVDLAWADNFGTESAFVVERCDTGACDTTWTTSATFTLGMDTTTLTDNSLCNGQTVSYRVQADRPGSQGWPSPYSNVATVSTPAVAPPANLTATRVSEEEIQLSWSNGTTDEESLILERCSGAACDFSAATAVVLPPGTTSYLDQSLTPDTTYRYRMRAEKNAPACGWTTAWSAIAEATTTLTPPVLLSADPASTTSAALTWQDTTGNETDFLIERCTGSGCTDFVPVAAAERDATSGIDPTACYGTTYTYRISAVNQGLANGGLGCWSQRLPLTVSGLAAPGPVRIEIAYQTGMQTDFADIRFYDETTDRELPYTIESKADGVSATVWFRPEADGTVWLYYGNPEATDASNPDAVFLFVDTFPGTTIDTNRWVEIDPDDAIRQNDGLELHYINAGWTRALISQQAFDRAAGLTLYAEIVPQDSPGTDYFMLGWDKDQSTNPSYTQLVHGLYWPDSYLRVYELNANRNYQNTFAYQKTGPTYEMKVVLKASGARYYARKKGAASWTLIQETDGLTDSPLRPAITQNTHKARILMLAVLSADTMDTQVTLGAAEQGGTCHAFPNTWTATTAATLEVTTATPTAPYNLHATPLSESEIQLTWQDDNTDEDGAAIDRCLGSGCTDFVEIATLGPHTHTYTDTGLAMTTTYTYRVRTVKSSVCAWPLLATQPVEATTPAPPAPANVSATVVDGGHIRLDWTDTTGSNTGFVIERCQGAGCTAFAEIGAVGDVGTFTDDTVCPGQSYSYQVRAVNEDVGLALSNGGGNTWSRQAPITISDFAANAPIQLTVAWEPNMQADFDDLRFYDTTAGVELPYFIADKTDGVSAEVWFKPGANDTVLLVYGNPDAVSTADEHAVFKFYDDFRGATIDTGTWTVLDSAGKFSQNDGLHLAYKNYGWNSALISNTTIDRAAGKALYVVFQPTDGPANDYVMMGWEADQTTNASYTQLVHGLYWNNFGPLRVYEKNANIGYSQSIAYQTGKRYEMKIVLQAAGARYFVSGDGINGWQEIHHTTTYSDTPLRVAITQNTHQGVIEKIWVMPDVAVIPTATVGTATAGSRVWAGDPGTAAPADLTPPAPTPPTGLAATLADETAVDLGWTDTTPADHRIERCAGNGCATFTAIATIADPGGGGSSAYSDTGLTGGTDYTYRVSPVMGSGDCPWEDYGATVTITTTPACPADLQVTGNGTTTVDLAWTDTTMSETGFAIDRCTGSGCTTFTQVGLAAADATGYTDTTAQLGTSYTYQVRAVNDTAGWDSGACGPVTVTTDTPVTPQNLVAAWGSESRIELSWDPTGSDEDGFIVERGDAGCANFTVASDTVPAGATGYTDTGLARNTIYCYRVTAYKNLGQPNEWQAGPSATATATTDLLPPSGLAAAAKDSTTVELAWTNSTDTEEAVVLERCQGAACDFSTATTVTLPPGTTTYTDDTVCAATTYRYRVRTTNTTAGWDSGPSPPAAVTLPTPTAPQLALSEVAGDTDALAMSLAWTDTNPDEDGFSIERCAGASCTDFAPVATTAAAMNLDTFEAGIDPNRWVQEGRLDQTSNTTPPIAMTDSEGGVTIDDSAGVVDITVTSDGTDSGWNIGRLDLVEPVLLGSGDFDFRLTLHLPDGPPAATSVRQRPLRLRINFPDPDGYGPRTADSFYLDRYIDSTGQGYEAVFTVDGTQTTATLAAVSDTVTVRMTRTGGVLAVAVDEGTGFVTVGSAGPQTTVLAPELVRFQVQVDRSGATTVHSQVDDVRLATAHTGIVDASGLAAETTYCYRVVATKAGNGCAWDPASVPVVSPVVCDTTRPPAPQALTATPLNSRLIQLDWTPISSTEDGFVIEKLSPTGHWVAIDRAPAGATGYVAHFGIDPETSSTFRVRAYRGDDLSGVSNEASATTPAWQEGDGTCVQ